MSRKIYKYPLQGVYQGFLDSIELPYDAKVVHVDLDSINGTLCLWAFVDPHNVRCKHEVLVQPTGGIVPENMTYVGTAVNHTESLVWHVFIGAGIPLAPIERKFKSRELGG